MAQEAKVALTARGATCVPCRSVPFKLRVPNQCGNAWCAECACGVGYIAQTICCMYVLWTTDIRPRDCGSKREGCECDMGSSGYD